jgi:hypothetical protein
VDYAEQLAAAHALAERRLGRQLTRAERVMDVIEIDRVLYEGKLRLQRAIDAEQKRAATSFVRYRLPLRLELTQAMTGALVALYHAGQKAATREIRALGRRLGGERSYAEKPPTPAEIEKLAEQLRPFLGYIGQKTQQRIIRAELGHVGRESIYRKAGELVRDAVKAPGARDAAGRFVSSALAGGRAATYEEHEHLFSGWQYTAIMDKATCAECRSLDGTVYDTLEAAYAVLPNFGPNPKCYGDGRCRCTLVPVV